MEAGRYNSRYKLTGNDQRRIRKINSMLYNKRLLLVILPVLCWNTIWAQKQFVHPGILHSKASLQHIYNVARHKIMPEYGSYELLRDHPLASAQYNMNGPYSIISRDGQYAYTKSKMEA